MVTTAGPHLYTATLIHPSCVTRHWRHRTQDWDPHCDTILRGSEVGSVLLLSFFSVNFVHMPCCLPRQMNDTQSWSHNGGWMDGSRPQMTDSLLPWARGTGDHVPCWSLLRCHDKPPNVQQNTNTSCYKLEIKEIRRVTTGNNMSRRPLQRCSVVILRSGWVDCRAVNQPSRSFTVPIEGI